MKKTKFLVASLFVAFAITLASCGGNTEKKAAEAKAHDCEQVAKDSCQTAAADSCKTVTDTCQTAVKQVEE